MEVNEAQRLLLLSNETWTFLIRQLEKLFMESVERISVEEQNVELLNVEC